MNDRSKLLGNASIYLGANILNAAVPFILLPILTRVLTPADYGTVAMFSIILSIMSAFTGLSVQGAIGVKYFQLARHELAEYVGTCVGILMISTSLLFLLLTVLGSWLAKLTGVPSDWLLVGAALSGLQFFGNIRLLLWQVSGEARKYGCFQISQSLLNAGFSLFLILVVGLAWQGRILGQVFAVGVFGIIGAWWLMKDGLLSRPSNWRHQGSDALKFGIPLIPHAIGGLVIATGGQFMVTNMLGVSETGIYVVGVQVGAVLGLIADAFVKSYGPWLYEKLKDNSISTHHQIVGMTYCVFLFFFILSLTISGFIFLMFPLIIGQKFSDARFFSIFFIFGNGFIGMYYAVAGFFFFTYKTKFISIVSIISGAISILVMWKLGSMFGVAGVAFGYLSAQVIMFVFAWIMSNLVYPLPWFQFRSAFSAISLVLSRK
jgi:O-antigen/teichoic acid export membrane protein